MGDADGRQRAMGSRLQSWADGVHFATDAKGREEMRDADGRVLMLESERREMARCVEDMMLRPGSRVLEVGFGCGFSADRIQEACPAEHVIIECAPAALRRLREWAAGRPSVRVVQGTWQARLPELGTFDGIFFDACGAGEELNAEEMAASCPQPEYRSVYARAAAGRLEGVRPGTCSAFEQLARLWHCRPGARIASGEGTEFRQWADGFFYSVDLDGHEQLLDADGMQVMMEWERPYMVECVERLGVDSSCDVLEIGFGCGYSADCIQQKKPRSHTIIECAEAVLERLHRWAADKPSVRVVEGTWQTRLPDLGIFDCIFFDDYGLPGHADREMERCPRPEYREEYSRILNLDGGSHFEAFLRLATTWHGRPGTRLSGFVLHALPDLEDAGIEAFYQHMKVAPPPNCNYFFSSRAVVPLFVKKASPAYEDRPDLERSTSAGESPSPSPSPAWSGGAAGEEHGGGEGGFSGGPPCGPCRARSRSPHRPGRTSLPLLD